MRRALVLCLAVVATTLVGGASSAHALTGVTIADVDFGTVQYDTTTTRVVQVTNSSGVGLFILSAQLSDAQFTETGNPAGVPGASQCSGSNIPSGGSCSIGVSFTPGAVGVRQGVLTLNFRRTSDNSTFGAATVNLTANVINGSIAVPAIDFGAVRVGVKQRLSVELVNTGIGRIAIKTVSSNDAQFTTAAYDGSSGIPTPSQCDTFKYFQPGGRCSIFVYFTPSARGPRSATLTITTTAGAFTQALSGEGVRTGYWMVTSAGVVYPFGDVSDLGHPSSTSDPVVKLEPNPGGDGYWILSASGHISAYGAAANLGSLSTSTLIAGERASTMSSTASGAGYWIFTTRGRAVPFGDARAFGDMSGVPLNGPVLGSVATPSGQGYYMVASDGGIFAFGDASFHGSMGGVPLNAPVMGLVPTRDNEGYWLVANDGGVFAFNAPFRGSMGNGNLNKPIVSMIRFGDGYLMVASDGGIFNFSNQQFLGSLGANPPSSPVTSVGAVS